MIPLSVVSWKKDLVPARALMRHHALSSRTSADLNRSSNGGGSCHPLQYSAGTSKPTYERLVAALEAGRHTPLHLLDAPEVPNPQEVGMRTT